MLGRTCAKYFIEFTKIIPYIFAIYYSFSLKHFCITFLFFSNRPLFILLEYHLTRIFRTAKKKGNLFNNLYWGNIIYYNCYYPANILTLDQPCFNVVHQRWNNAAPTLKMKQNPTSDFQRCTTLIQRQCPTLKQRRNNVTQRWYNVDTMLFQLSVNVS